ncbi:MAG: AHH domain-containing protein [Alphaproteobacteria bacterium]|jgi:hypothetical protein
MPKGEGPLAPKGPVLHPVDPLPIKAPKAEVPLLKKDPVVRPPEAHKRPDGRGVLPPEAKYNVPPELLRLQRDRLAPLNLERPHMRNLGKKGIGDGGPHPGLKKAPKDLEAKKPIALKDGEGKPKVGKGPYYKELKERARNRFGPGQVEVHHIISPKNEIVANHKLWDLAGIDKDARENLVLLPTPKGANVIEGKRAIHKGRHDERVHWAIREQMDNAERLGELNGWQQHQYAEAMRRIMAAERKALIRGERALGQKNARVGERIDLELNVDFGGI